MSLSTRTILLQLQDSPMRTFLANWVMFEELVVDIHASGKIDEEDLDLLGSLRYAIQHHYEQWADMLLPYWQQVKVAGKRLRQDPFLNMLETSLLTAREDSYTAVESLSAVRETLNLMVADQKI